MVASVESAKDGDMVGKGSAMVELFYGTLSGMAYGMISPIAGQPFDVVKTKMQADAAYRGKGAFATATGVLQVNGVRGFFQGMLPIIASTGVQKTALFSAYAGARRATENSGIPALTDPIPLSAGLKPGIIVGGVTAAAARAAVETPFELIKVRWQTGGSMAADGKALSASFTQVRELYVGGPQTFYRSAMMLCPFFVFVDYSERFFPELMAVPLLGGFLKGGCCATVAWGIAWPFETVKSMVQSKDGARGSTLSIMADIIKKSGPLGLWRGFLPGAFRSIAANGAGMAVYQFTQKKARS